MNCYHCVSKPATCIGAYEGAELPAPACDECCGHACEDGWCIPTASLAEREPLVQEVIRLSNVIDDHQRAGRSNVVDGMVDAELRIACRKLARWTP